MERSEILELIRSSVVVMPDESIRRGAGDALTIVELGGELQLATRGAFSLRTGLKSPQQVPAGTPIAVAVRREMVPSLRDPITSLLATLPDALRKKLRAGWFKQLLEIDGLTLRELGVELGSITAAMAVAALGELLGILKVRRPSLATLASYSRDQVSLMVPWRLYWTQSQRSAT